MSVPLLHTVTDVDLRPVLNKLGHKLEEIRVRALQNIWSKLEHGLICEADLVQERILHINLLEWFNHNHCPNKEEVLKLIKRLSKHGSSVKQFLEIGGPSFLSKLRADTDDSLKSIIDDILDNLLSFPNEEEAPHTTECIYQHQQTNNNESGCKPVLHEMNRPSVAEQSTSQLPQQYGYFKNGTKVNVQHTTGYSNSVSTGIKGLKFSTFPWLALTPTDRHVLISTNSSLCSPRPSLVHTSCEFVSDVVLQDFPAEIFLQRPSIAKSLISLVGLKPLSSGDHSIPLSAMKCLRELSSLLMSRHEFYHDPALYCPKQDFGSRTTSSASSGTGRASCSTGQSTLSSDSRPSVIGRNEPRVRGDGRDRDSPSSVDSSPMAAEISASGSETDSEDAMMLQFSQLTLAQFSCDVLVHVIPLLKTANTEVLMSGVYLLREVLRLIEISITADIWNDECAAGRALVDKLCESFDNLGEVLEYHYQLCHNDDHESSTIVSKDGLFNHRLSMIAVLSLVKNLLQHLVPLDKAADILPEGLALSVFNAVMDAGLVHCLPQVRPVLLPFLKKCLPSKHALYKHSASVCTSMEKACHFIQQVDQKNPNMKELLDLAEASLMGLHYHKVVSVVDKYVQLCSTICCLSSGNDEDLNIQSRKILLQLLAYPEETIQTQTYAACLNIIKDVINVKEVVKPSADEMRRIVFLFDTHILYEICCFGLKNSNKDKVCRHAEELLLHLLQGKLIMGCSIWHDFLQACIPVLPLLQGVSDTKSQLSRCILDLIQPSIHCGQVRQSQDLSGLEKLRGSLRLLFCAEQSVRLEGAKALMWYLSQEADKSRKLPSLDMYTLKDVADLLFMDHPVSLDMQDSGPSAFSIEGLLQVFGIFTAVNSEDDLRKSALEQIAIIVQDVSVHKAFLSQGGLEKVIECIQQVTSVSMDSFKQNKLLLIPACMCILRHILHANVSLRHQLAHQDSIYLLLLRGALLCYTDSRVRYHASHIMVLLLFDEVASLSTDENQSVNHFSLPKCVSQKYRLPFRGATVKSQSIHRIELPLLDDAMKRSPVAWRMVKLVWNTAWYGGIKAMIQRIQSNTLLDSPTSFDPDLALSKEEQDLMTCSHITTSLTECLKSLQEATHHYAVKMSLWRLSLWLLTDMVAQDGTNKSNPDITQCLVQLEFNTVLARFIAVFPSNTDDKLLLAEVLSFLMLLLKSLALHPPHTDFLHWLGNMACNPKCTITDLVIRSKHDVTESDRQGRHEDVSTTSQRFLHKQLLAFLGFYIQSLPLSCQAWRRKTGYLGGSLTHALLLSLNSADATHFYDLPSLENTLHALVHVTARPGWSLDWADGDSMSLCQLLLNSLLEVVSAFHVGRGGTAMSYMGKGVTKSATLCLCHLAHEMATRSHQKSWPSEWLYTRQRPDEQADVGLGWLTPLWSYRDPEVRAAGLAIAAILSSTEEGRVTVTTGCEHLPGGLWAMAFGVLLDQSECSIVRQQATLLLVNLLSQDQHSGNPEEAGIHKVWAGLVIDDQQTKVSVCGLPALLAVLKHYNVYESLRLSLCYYYGHASIQPVSVVEESTVASSSVASAPSTTTTTDLGSNQGDSGSNTPASTELPFLLSGLQPQILSATVNSDHEVNTFLTMQNDQGSSRPDSSQSSSTVSIPHSNGRYISVVTPSFISAICRLLLNLLALSPKETKPSMDEYNINQSLIRLIDVEHISGLLHHLSVTSTQEQRKIRLQLSAHLTMYRDILQLLQAYKRTQNPNKSPTANIDTTELVLACRLLGVSSTEATGSCTWKYIHDVWESTFSLLLTHITTLHQAKLKDLLPVMVKYWKNITDSVIHIMKTPMDSSTRIVALNFLSTLLSGLQYRVNNKATLKQCSRQEDSQDEEDNIKYLLEVLDDTGQTTGSGITLCSVLLEAYDGTLPRCVDTAGCTHEMTSIICALRNLLAFSQQAKTTAIQSGLVDSLVDSMQHTHAKLNLQCLQHPRPSAKKKEEPLLLKLIGQMELLQNCLYQCKDAKMTALEAGLTVVLLKLWSWSILDNRLLLSTLSLLTVYTANFLPACSSVVQCAPGQRGSSLFHRIIQQLDRNRGCTNGQSGDEQLINQRIIHVLGNAVWSAECRNALWKTGFLQNFSQVQQRKRKPTKQSPASKQLSAALWLHLLANLTFSPEGQQMVMRIPEALDLLLVFGESSSGSDVEYLATLILCNLCFPSANKPKLLASDKLLLFFESKLKSGVPSVRYIAVDAMWALLYGSQKAKAILKGSIIFQSLLDSQSSTLVIHPQPLTLSKGHERLADMNEALSNVVALMVD
ncbi:rotatin-like [Asterias amurensis]|uniref:rotatin-like n=1 Tax=Asterias amurensis TaxID=7602 RepID=UPI003AB74C71